ncbi:uncharacterized protein CcaverHIS019_0206540 [Cutaneotrichosporon cavernicola]|uniref:Phosphomethylpyrimidine kinase n=1 Tax=Cutaneotrichosporon cavernicola TaxID=279322 RepID=A0AA48I4Q1_9TREE|nr:uncharacterized protein CcaverHIS019_0206540 [Cutaneotrichosporon cavernicola]BEI89292.1 hypothetical protein CcaverHIS019_0206540 [Cutaneotrichosporon cavernicola]BEI97068.1 hypothetical protein CcaverHIS631_0206570 [Cutaneotrichosporon cavernicola]BEJ04841.1 hypothetical protein CcaverHIS641_0206580 [Cutaneotrichosporon cavernicola]
MNLDAVIPPHVLTIAGSDSGGGAGIQADLKTVSALGCYGSSVITALTAQNTLGVQGVHVVPPEFVTEQLESLFSDDLVPTAIKFGMLAGPPTISALASYLSALATRPFLVLDPVMISTSGHELLAHSARHALMSHLLPLVDLVTPNIPEAGVLLGSGSNPNPKNLGDVVALAKELYPVLNGPALLLKGGHLPVTRSSVEEFIEKNGDVSVVWLTPGPIAVIDDYRATLNLAPRSEDVVVDLLVEDDGMTLVVGPCVDTSSTHGTGCTLSAALASCYALEAEARQVNGDKADKPNGDMKGRKRISHDAVRKAIAYTQTAIATAPKMGRGNGPLNHGHSVAPRVIPTPTIHNPAPFTSHLIANAPDWDAYVKHPFVIALGNGTLPREAFVHYITQDYHYLRHYARAHAAGAARVEDMATIRALSEIALHVARESEMHIEFCASFGISRADLEALPESAASSAYARYVLDMANSGDVLDMLVAVLSCLIGYGEVGLWLKSRVATGETIEDGNPYKRWMDDYAGPDFIGAVRRGIATLEERVVREQPSAAKVQRLSQIFAECTRLERAFWQMGLDQSW